MNHAVGVAASLAVKRVLDEEHTDRPQRLWADCSATRRPIVVPPHLTGEVTSALYQRTRRADLAYHLTVTDAGDAQRDFLAYPVAVVTVPGLYARRSPSPIRTVWRASMTASTWSTCNC